jgi:hypothetical protein
MVTAFLLRSVSSTARRGGAALIARGAMGSSSRAMAGWASAPRSPRFRNNAVGEC